MPYKAMGKMERKKLLDPLITKITSQSTGHRPQRETKKGGNVGEASSRTMPSNAQIHPSDVKSTIGKQGT
jgi:hypothetical protein